MISRRKNCRLLLFCSTDKTRTTDKRKQNKSNQNKMGFDGGTIPSRSDLLRRASWRLTCQDNSRSTRGGQIFHSNYKFVVVGGGGSGGDRGLPKF